LNPDMNDEIPTSNSLGNDRLPQGVVNIRAFSTFQNTWLILHEMWHGHHALEIHIASVVQIGALTTRV